MAYIQKHIKDMTVPERAYHDMEVRQEIKAIAKRHKGSPDFIKSVMYQLAKQEMAERNELEQSSDDEPGRVDGEYRIGFSGDEQARLGY